MTQYREIILGNEAKEYISDRLTLGKTLASILLQTCNIEKGQVTTFLPSYIAKKTAKEFETGKLKPDPNQKLVTEKYRISCLNGSATPVPTTDFYLVSLIHSYLNKKENNLCIFEEANSKPTDPFVLSGKMETRFLTHKDEIYHFLLNQDNKVETIEQTISFADAWLFIGIMTSLPQEMTFSLKKKKLTLKELKILSERTEKIIIGAYDGEGYLIWHS